VEKGGKLGQLPAAPCSPNLSGIKSLAAICVKNHGEKHHKAFVKVVEDSEIYNFPIHHLVHFSCKISK
jgi:hypothetical protein